MPEVSILQAANDLSGLFRLLQQSSNSNGRKEL